MNVNAGYRHFGEEEFRPDHSPSILYKSIEITIRYWIAVKSSVCMDFKLKTGHNRSVYYLKGKLLELLDYHHALGILLRLPPNVSIDLTKEIIEVFLKVVGKKIVEVFKVKGKLKRKPVKVFVCKLLCGNSPSLSLSLSLSLPPSLSLSHTHTHTHTQIISVTSSRAFRRVKLLLEPPRQKIQLCRSK